MSKANSLWMKTIISCTALSLIIGLAAGLLGAIYLAPLISQNNLTDIDQQKIIELDQQSATIDAAQKAAPAVVSIVVTKELKNYYNQTGPLWFFDLWGRELPPDQSQESQKQIVGGGTGFIISSDGLILTNKHVVADEDAQYSVILNDETQYQAQILDKDFINDIAVLKIEAFDLPILELGDSDQIKIGQTVIAIGYTLGEYKNTVTKGVVSGINRTVTAGSYNSSEVLEAVIQTDAAINPGNSGGPLLDLQGKVIGINTAINQNGESIGFAIPINIARAVVNSVQQYGKIVRPWLGVRYVNLNEKIAKANNLSVNYGALIIRGNTAEELAVSPGSPADKAGLQENDIILEINGKKLEKVSLAYELQKYQPGDEIELKIIHQGQEKSINVALESREE